MKRDTAYAQRMTTADFTFAGPDGAVVRKADHVKSIAGPSVFTEFKVDDAKVRIYGDAAIVVGLGSIKGHLGKDDLSGKYSWTDVFVKQNGAWRMVAAHVTMVAKK